MKKHILTILTVTVAGVVMTATVFAATNISLEPASVNVQEGQNFTLQVAVNPQGTKNYTVKAKIDYPPDLLEIRSFTFGSGWIPLSQPGYDLVDNKNGTLVKTAGYPGGVSEYQILGTISFVAKKTGSGSIKVGSNSLTLDANNANTLSGASASSAITVTAPAPKSQVTNQPVTKTSDSANKFTGEQEEAGDSENALTKDRTSLMASMIGFITIFPVSLVLGIAIGTTIMLILRRKKLI